MQKNVLDPPTRKVMMKNMKNSALFLYLITTTSAVIAQQYYSQSGQDRYLNEQLFKGKQNGVFIDIGAHNGIIFSNTYFFEKELQWTGICIEPIPEIFQQLQQNRRCVCLQGCIANSTTKQPFLRVTGGTAFEYTEMLSGLLHSYDLRHLDRIDRELLKFGGKKEIIMMQCYTLNDILEQYAIKHIDYLSIDTEGSELDILKAIDFSTITIDVITVENNYNTDHIKNFLTSQGYEYLTKLEGDEIYKRIDTQ